MAQRLFKHIPNNKKGKEFISELRNHIDRDIVKVVKCRGRGKRKFTYTSKQGKQITSYHKDLNLDQAEKLAVYFEFDNQADYEHKYYKADSRLTSLEYTSLLPCIVVQEPAGICLPLSSSWSLFIFKVE